MPDKRSLAFQEYYAHRENKFWKIIVDKSKKDIL